MTEPTWERVFDSYEPMHALVAESNGAGIGFAHDLFHRNTIMVPPIC